MTKSRQPGKPAKLAGSGRKLVSAFRPTSDTTPVEDNEFTKAAKEICLGLAIFRFIFGREDESQSPPFHGFSPHEIKFAADKCSIRRRQVENEHKARGVLFNPFMVGKQRTIPLSSPFGGTSQSRPSGAINKQVCKSEDVKHVPKPSSNENILRKKTLKHQMQKAVKCPGRNGETPSGSPNPMRSIARKFVLPVRSAHSSRVIKPNKRFRDIDDDTSSHDSSEGIRVKKLRVSVDTTDDDSSSSSTGKKLGESSDAESISGWSSSVSTAGSSVKDEDFQPRARSKVILRKAKLKVNEPEAPAIKGPFSAGGPLIPQKVVCGVCGAIRFYRYLKQARKFGIFSCEPCRKFISRIMNALWIRKNSDVNTAERLSCKSGTGHCYLPHYVKDPGTGAYNGQRCKACWLKTCLQTYRMPHELARPLSEWLPRYMREDDSSEVVSLQKPKIEMDRKRKLDGDIAKIITKRALRTIARKDADTKMKTKPGLTVNKVIRKINHEIKEKRPRGRPRLHPKLDKDGKPEGKEDKLSRIQRKREEKLVRLHKLKGPRVKHVCRSASLVLGQPVATFTDTSPSKPKQTNSGKATDDGTASVTSDLSRNSRSLEDLDGKSSESGSRIRQPCNDSESSKNKSLPKTTGNSDSTEEGLLDGKARTLQDLSRQHYELVNGETAGDDLGLISIHFWESYDPEEVGRNGFALIGIGDASVPNAICFICGSAGLDKLIHCVCCCEPYHQYCVEASGSSGSDGDWWQVDWVCARCTLCCGCGRGGGSQVACQKCHKSYHTECLAADRVASRLHSADRPWVCQSCLCCKSCNQAEVYKFVGNLPLCKVCFKLRQKGNFCPLCQRCYDENDFDTKMMECERCKCWVHAKCEGLSNEKYNILSILPDSVEFVCKMCCKMPPAPWWLAVETEMKAGFLAVLKSLSKNRKACDLLKCSPTKMPYPVCHCGVGARQRTVLRFPDISEQSDAESSEKLQSESQKEETLKSEEECLKSLPTFSAENAESLACDPKNETSEKQLNLCDTRTKFSAADGSMIAKSGELQLKLDSDTISYQNGEEKPSQFSPHATSQSDSGIGSTDDELKSTNDQCICLELESCNKTPVSLLTIKKKVNSNDYDSLDCFNKDMEEMMTIIHNEELLKIYYQTLEDIFPWFNPKGTDAPDPTTRINHPSETTKNVETVPDKKPDEIVLEDVSVTLKGKLNLTSDYYYNLDKSVDNRMCVLCKQLGEGKTTEEGRLLYCGQNDWVHTNCALWSSEVFEEIDGSLQNVQSAVSRSRHIRCSHCSKKGASVGCCNRTCPEAYHFPCAREGDCVFYEDKSLFCANHKDDTVSSRLLTAGPDFLVSRPVYVELEKKKKKSVPRQSIKLVIGSLTISSLGDFNADLSDQESSIIPCNFQCTRLFWSSVEPWRLVQYHIRTKIVYTCETSLEDENYTIDHSFEENCVSGDEDFSLNMEIENDTCTVNEDVCMEKEIKIEETLFEVDENEVKETLDLIIDNVCIKEEDDPQASDDLLPPDLEEALFMDLPHDLIDGISMQDIFPKLMNFEPSNLEFKPEKECKPIVKTNPNIQSSGKVNINYDLFPNIFESKVSLKRIELKEKCEIQPDGMPPRKLRSRSTDKKKIDKSEGKENSKKFSLSKILQIDGAGDVSSDADSLSDEISSPPSLQTQRLNCRPQLSKQDSYLINAKDDYISCSSDCSSPERDLKDGWKLSQLDGVTDFCTVKDKSEDENPVKCARCHRTYRTAQSLERHLQTCNVDFLSCSESDSSEEEKTNSPEAKLEIVGNSNSNFPTKIPELKSNVVEIDTDNNQHQRSSDFDETTKLAVESQELSSLYSKNLVNPPITITPPSSQTYSSSFETAIPNCSVVLNKIDDSSIFGTAIPNCSVVGTAIPTCSAVGTAIPNCSAVGTAIPNCSAVGTAIPNCSAVETVTPNCSVVLNKIDDYHTYPAKQKIMRPSYECEDTLLTVSPACGRTSPVRIRPVSRKTYSRRKPDCTSTTMSLVQPKTVEYQISNPPALIIHQVPSHNVVPSYIENLQTQPAVQANNIQYQYITTLDMQEKPQQIPVTLQIQPQISLQPVIAPTVLGTLIQPNGVEQLVVNAPDQQSTMVINQQPTNVYLTNVNPQPVYMGMETVISNTVMSTSQFVSGVITGSSYSATTTQVFQTAKPVIDVPQSYVVVNTPPNPVQNNVQTVYPPSDSQPWTYNYQETYKVKERTTYQQVTRQVTQEDLNSMKMVNSAQDSIFINKPVVQEVTVEKTHSIQKTVPLPGLPYSFSNVNSASINNHLDNTQYSHEKVVFNNHSLTNCSSNFWNEQRTPKIMEISDEQEKLLVPSLRTNELSSQMNQSIQQPMFDGTTCQNINISQPVQKERNLIKPVINSVDSINVSKPAVIIRKSPIKPVITKVKASSKEKTNSCNVFYVNSPLTNLNLSNDKQPPCTTIAEPDTVKSEPLLEKIEPIMNNTKTTKQENTVVNSKSKAVQKRLPLKENKVVGNKQKPCKISKKSSSVANMAHPKLMYEITSQDGVSICSQDVEDAWQKIFDAVQEGRSKKRLPPLPRNSKKSYAEILGLENNSVKFLLEQLPGVKSCTKYKPVYHKTKLFGHSEVLRENPTGCARTEPISNKKRKYDMFSWLASRHRQPPKLIISTEAEIINGISRRATSTSLPMAMRFRHLKETSKEAVGVFRSDIHGRGLFCLRDIDGGEMVIEYAGEVIRAGLTDKREHYYTSKGIGCYMFRIDDHFVVDATMHGNAARFINHSCEPNCYSKVVDILGKKHILIFALRKIVQGEELTYDYKFPLEDEKISCHCLSRKCRKYLN
ncbi:histone-lysine N-methyltransferase trithorax-like [Macrosteles quadrilineatus]|uniref:histone-lysine N-methyltransferase trithorax-like n=1 Tax=Macrosteles quadrilineatus TaxID=74068 RepID=UPI0023E0A623|nr:histone-lysine N-methyltransferase trithorax-like [Macrosteles quadrilineatus]